MVHQRWYGHWASLIAVAYVRRDLVIPVVKPHSAVVLNRGARLPSGASINLLRGTSPLGLKYLPNA